MTAHSLPPLQQVLGRDEHVFIDDLMLLWDYCGRRRNELSALYEVDQQQLIFGDARIFDYDYRCQLLHLAQAYYADHVRRFRAIKLDEFYIDLVATIRSRPRISYPSNFFNHVRQIYNAAREHGVAEHALRIKVNKAARVTRYFSPLKLWKDCTSPDPTIAWLQHHD
jgi:hypothetical protein